jgi:hypothetical protein
MSPLGIHHAKRFKSERLLIHLWGLVESKYESK